MTISKQHFALFVTLFASILFSVVLVDFARATSHLGLAVLPTGPTTARALTHLFEIIINWVFAGFLVLAVVFIILAAIQFLTKAGEPAQISQARMKLVWAAIAIAIAVTAKGLVTVIRSIVGS